MIRLRPSTNILAVSNGTGIPNGSKVSLGKTEASGAIAGVALPVWTPWASQHTQYLLCAGSYATSQEHSSEEDRQGTSSLGAKYSSRRSEVMNIQRR